MAKGLLLTTDTEDLKEILSNGKFYAVPPYQRGYSWTLEHWEDLWEDLQNLRQSDEDHYMGALVLETEDRKQFRIIDGQQRLTTLSILILACVDALDHLSTEGVDKRESAERASLLESSYIGAKDAATLRITPKLSLNANDDDFFQLNIAQRKPPHGSLRNLRDSERLMWECFRYYRSRIEKTFDGGDAGQAIASFVSDVVGERLVFITVRVQDQLSAYTVFETLNARGLELSETDLLKNYLLSLADRLSRSQMSPVLRQWARITARVGSRRFPEFLRHHLNSRRKYVRQRQLFKIVKRDVTEVKQVFPLLDALEEDAAWYEALRDPAAEFWLDFPGAREQVRVLNLFRVTQYIPLMLAARDVFESPADRVEILRYCAIVSFRFNMIGRRSTHGLEETYNHVALCLRQGEARTLRDVRRLLKPIYIPDDEFEADFTALSIRNRGGSGKRLRYILSRLESQVSGHDLSDETMKATVEHIPPERPSVSGWEHFSPEEHERYFERIGNYALLERALNQATAGSAPFEGKQAAYAQSQYTLSSELAEFDEWTPDAIARRQARLAAVARTVWRLEVD